jgi:hypothetical protein
MTVQLERGSYKLWVFEGVYIVARYGKEIYTSINEDEAVQYFCRVADYE